MEIFSRTKLLIGEEGLEKLHKATVMVLGVGGVGSHCIEALARGGVGTLILVDNDKVSPSNINRQSIAYHSTIGEYKTRVMKERILDINPNAEVYTYETFVLPDNLEEIFEHKVDYIIDAIDTVSAKIALAVYAKANDIPIISCMGTGNKLHPELFEIADLSRTSVCPLCKVMRRELKKREITHLKVLYSKEEPMHPGEDEKDLHEEPMPFEENEEKMQGRKRQTPGSVSFVPPVAGLLIAGEVVRDIAGV